MVSIWEKMTLFVLATIMLVNKLIKLTLVKRQLRQIQFTIYLALNSFAVA